MRFEGRLFKDGKFWLAEVPALHALTQGRSKKEAYAMIADLVERLADVPGFRVVVYPRRGTRFEVGANDVRALVALLLRRQREKRGVTLAEVARRLRQKSPNAYARYEQGRTIPTVAKLEELLRVLSPDREFVWREAT